MRYLKVDWLHDHPDEPVTFYSELDDERWEARQVWAYRSGAMRAAGHSIRPDYLSEVAHPPVEEPVTVELGPPYALTRGGWKRDTVKIGDKVTMQDTALAKDGSDRAGSTQNTFLVLSSGQKLPMR